MENKLIAYLIQAHNNPKHLLELVTALQNKKVSFFIHIDNKSRLDDFKCLFDEISNVYFVENRVKVNWKWFSQVEATILCIKLALSKNINYKYFILLSWSDFPFQSAKLICNFFHSQNKNFIEFKKIQKCNSVLEYINNKQLWFKISKYHFYDKMWINWNSKNRTIKHWVYRLYILFNILILNNILRPKKVDENLNYYFWSSWWCLNCDTIKYIINFYENNIDFNNVFKNSDASDEMYFQTIVMNSKFQTEVINDNLRYIDWTKDREWPAILNINDYKKIKENNPLYIRKISASSDTLIKKIKRERL